MTVWENRDCVCVGGAAAARMAWGALLEYYSQYAGCSCQPSVARVHAACHIRVTLRTVRQALAGSDRGVLETAVVVCLAVGVGLAIGPSSLSKRVLEYLSRYGIR